MLITAPALVLVVAGTLWAQGVSGPVGLRTTTVLQTTTTAQGQPLQFPLFRNQFTGVLFELAPGGCVGRHRHPVPNVVYVMEGELTVEADGHRPGRSGRSAAWCRRGWSAARSTWRCSSRWRCRRRCRSGGGSRHLPAASARGSVLHAPRRIRRRRRSSAGKARWTCSLNARAASLSTPSRR